MNDNVCVSVVFDCPARGTVLVKYGTLGGLTASGTGAMVSGADFAFDTDGPHRLDIVIAQARMQRGKEPTVVTVLSERNPFSFFLRDVTETFPITVPEFGVAVLRGDDQRTLQDVAAAVASLEAESDFERFEREPEETFENAARFNRNDSCPTWLGVGRDLRHFRVQVEEPTRTRGYWGLVRPMYHSRTVPFLGLPELPYYFAIGQGASCRKQITRRLEDGVLPILRSRQVEDDVTYHLTFFATPEAEPLGSGVVRGSDWLAAYCATSGNMVTGYRPETMSESEWDDIQRLFKSETSDREDTLVLVVRIRAENTGKVPRYAWFKTPRFNCSPPEGRTFVYLGAEGFSTVDGEYVSSVNRLDSAPMPDEEMAVLVMPGDSVTVEFLVPHSPISRERAERLSAVDTEAHLQACKAFWNARLEAAATFRVPERQIDERMRAGLLHCDLVTLGKPDAEPLVPTIGWYAPIGSESAPIIQYFDSVGWHDQARRCLDFFFARQRDDGFIQNFGRYELETGPVLWSTGEHFRYTGDRDWLVRIRPNVRKAVDYLLAWIRRNRQAEYKERGYYGMIEGKVADCNDFFHSFMLNAVTYLGLKRMAEVYAGIDDELVRELESELGNYRADIRGGFDHAMARAPVVPVGDGSWAPVMPPWVEYTGAISLYADGGNWYSHAAFASRSCLTGPLYLILGEVLDPDEIGAEMLLKGNQQPITRENAALSQPYYCRHDIAHIRRGEVKPFLKLFYNQLTALQDRETYTFWEHYYRGGEHKTHEEAWFLMQTRWMLYLEEADTLHLLKAVPRAWLKDGRRIGVQRAASYFGRFDMHVVSKLSEGVVEVAVRFHEPERRPRRLMIRVPHPDGVVATACEGGGYDPATETVSVDPVGEHVAVRVRYAPSTERKQKGRRARRPGLQRPLTL